MGRAASSDGVLMPPIDPIILRGDVRRQDIDIFARNYQGLHVPMSTMSVTKRMLAWENRLQFEEEK
jgi:hypothetical protein